MAALMAFEAREAAAQHQSTEMNTDLPLCRVLSWSLNGEEQTDENLTSDRKPERPASFISLITWPDLNHRLHRYLDSLSPSLQTWRLFLLWRNPPLTFMISDQVWFSCRKNKSVSGQKLCRWCESLRNGIRWPEKLLNQSVFGSAPLCSSLWLIIDLLQPCQTRFKSAIDLFHLQPAVLIYWIRPSVIKDAGSEVGAWLLLWLAAVNHRTEPAQFSSLAHSVSSLCVSLMSHQCGGGGVLQRALI